MIALLTTSSSPLTKHADICQQHKEIVELSVKGFGPTPFHFLGMPLLSLVMQQFTGIKENKQCG